MLKILKPINFIAFLAVAMVLPMTSSASDSGYYGGYGLDNGGDYWSGSPSSYSYDYYTPVYQSSYDYYPTQSYNNYSTPQYDYGNYNYGSGYTYPSYDYGNTGYTYPSYQASYTTTAAPSNTVVTANAVATASSNNTNTNTNINNNNVYVYTTPQGNAVVNNPLHQYLAVTCSPSTTNPRVGQTVTMTAYATGGTGNYSYSWSGDTYYYSNGPTALVTSNTTGTRTVTVTVRSG